MYVGSECDFQSAVIWGQAMKSLASQANCDCQYLTLDPKFFRIFNSTTGLLVGQG